MGIGFACLGLILIRIAHESWHVTVRNVSQTPFSRSSNARFNWIWVISGWFRPLAGNALKHAKHIPVIHIHLQDGGSKRVNCGPPDGIEAAG